MRSKAERIARKAGDSVCLSSPGGGGYGDPLQRDLAAVQADLDAGLVSRAVAEAAYGVVVASAVGLGDRHRYTRDPEASAIKRQALGQALGA